MCDYTRLDEIKNDQFRRMMTEGVERIRGRLKII